MTQYGSDKDRLQKVFDRISDKAVADNYPPEMQRTLHLIREHDLVGAMISRAFERGEFDNLEGAGKPIILDEYPFEPDDLRMLHKILKDNGYAPHWIELKKEIDALKVKLDHEVEHFIKYTRIVFREKRGRGAMRYYENKKKNTYIQIRRRLEAISRKITDYNLNCPVMQLNRANIIIDDEMNRIVQEIEAAASSQKDDL